MKRMLLLIFLLPTFCIGQKMSVKIDKFTDQKTILTDELLIINRKAKWPHLYIRFRSVDSTCFIFLKGDGICVGVVGPDDYSTILLDDKSKIMIWPTGIQSYTGEIYDHQYSIRKKDVYKLTQNKIVSIRRAYNANYGDIDIEDSHAVTAINLANLFYNELNKQDK